MMMVLEAESLMKFCGDTMNDYDMPLYYCLKCGWTTLKSVDV